MPWQRFVADVAGEVDPGSGRLVYREVVLTVPRQSGKTTLILSEAVQRALGFGGRQGIVYTAQTRIDARKKWEDEHLPILVGSPFGSLVRARRSTGQEAFIWRNGSIHGLVSATKKSGHGPTLDLAFLDEAFAHEDDRLEQAFRPAMITRPEPQLWVVSTAGTAASTFLRGKVLAGRARLDDGQPSPTAYFEYSAPDDADPVDPATWRECMPALGLTIAEDAIRGELTSMLEEHGSSGLGLFRRAYLNQWVDEFDAGWHVITEAAWRARGGAQARPDGPVALAVEAAWPDAEFASIGVAGRGDGDLLVQVLDHRPGASWVVPRMVELAQRHRPCAVVIDIGGPAGFLVDELRTELEPLGVLVVTPSVRAIARAAGQFLAEVTGDEPSLRHYGQPELDASVAAAEKRPLGDAWTWARRGLTDISPLVAVTLAVHGFLVYGAPVDLAANVW